MNIGYPDTKNKQGSGDCGCGSPLYAKYDDIVPEVIETSYEGGLGDAAAKVAGAIKNKREANKKKKETTKKDN
jgi:hypothetical protein